MFRQERLDASALVVTAGVVLTFVAACNDRAALSPPTTHSGGTSVDWFEDRAHAAGLDFVHFNGMSGVFYEAEIMGSGVALLDYDNDGDLDVYLVQGQMIGAGRALSDALFPPTGPLKDRLFRNDLATRPDGTRTLHFTDVTDQSGIDVRSYGMGVATGDFNNDGFVDIYRTSIGGGVMLRNNGDGTFTDATRHTGTLNAGEWAVSAAFLDYDRDGWLDLFVGNYLQYRVDADRTCTNPAGRAEYCDPTVYRPARNRLFHNQRDGRFNDVTATAFLGGDGGPTLGVVAADFNGDGWPDIYVANDRQENQLWINQRDGSFKNTAVLAGAALSAGGTPEASMGVDAGDFDNDGDEDLVMTNLVGEGTTLYMNYGAGSFDDIGHRSGLRPASLHHTGFGIGWVDFDNDGWLDVVSVNGAVRTIEALAAAGERLPLKERMQLLQNLGDRRFADVSDRAGTVFQPSEVGRGAAFGDIDNDGDVDVVVANNNGPARLLVNNVGNRHHWLGLRLTGASVARDMLGARVAIVRKSGPTIWRRVKSDGSYASASDPRIVVGLGDSPEVPAVRVSWPSGRSEEWHSVPVDRLGTVLYMMGDMRGALEQFDEALALAPRLAPAQYSMALLEAAGGRQERAISHFSAAVAGDPNYLEAQLGLARLRRYREARDVLTEGTALQPDHVELALALARLLAAAPDEHLRDGARALAMSDAIIRQQTDAPTFEIMETRAMALAELTRYDEAAALAGRLVAQAERTGLRDLAERLTVNFRRYERGEPCRIPWADDDPIHAPGPPFDPEVAKLFRTRQRPAVGPDPR